jgi:hypothetical protein
MPSETIYGVWDQVLGPVMCDSLEHAHEYATKIGGGAIIFEVRLDGEIIESGFVTNS